jgi:hypothetical protein
MKKIPTAEEFLKSEIYNPWGDAWTDIMSDNDLKACMEAYANMKAKLHVKAALEAASESARVGRDWTESLGTEYHYVEKRTILNAYPLENIK